MTTPQEILALEERRWGAILAADLAALAALLHEDLVYTHAHALVDSKQSYLAGLQRGPGRIRTAVRSEEQVRVLGDTAFVAGALDSDYETAGVSRRFRVRFTSVWTKTPAGWQFVAWQSTARP